MISIELFGNPIPQKRPRFTKQGHCYDDQKRLKEGYQWQIRSQFRAQPLKMPLAIDLVFFMPIPKSTSAIKKRQMANGLIAPSKKPDLDNLQKLILDCLNKLVFDDDAQICEIRARKIYAERPRTLVRVLPLADEKRELLYENCARENR